MLRRNFLKTVCVAPFVVGMGTLDELSFWLNVDTENRVISLRGCRGRTCTLNELYNYVAELFDNSELMSHPSAMKAMTPHIYEMENGWKIDEPSMKFLTGGALTQDGEVWSSPVDYGQIPESNSPA